MRMVNMREAKTHLSRLVKAASEGEPCVIERAGTPIVKVTAVGTPDTGARRGLGFLTSRIRVPKNSRPDGDGRDPDPVRRW